MPHRELIVGSNFVRGKIIDAFPRDCARRESVFAPLSAKLELPSFVNVAFIGSPA
jgi:hypothetical protein